VSLKTVRNHVSNIFLKLQVADRHRPSYAPGGRWDTKEPSRATCPRGLNSRTPS
jgi:hypothetical protein